MMFASAASNLRGGVGGVKFYVASTGMDQEQIGKIQELLGADSMTLFSSQADLILKTWDLPPHSVSRMFIFSHGYSNASPIHGNVIALGPGLDVQDAFFSAIAPAHIFRDNAMLLSHACNTGMGHEASLAARIAATLQIPVLAWDGRTSYAHKDGLGRVSFVYASRVEGGAKGIVDELWQKVVSGRFDTSFLQFNPNGTIDWSRANPTSLTADLQSSVNQALGALELNVQWLTLPHTFPMFPGH
jgi:hypothetical protein